jgi:hypothetical protein
LSMSSPTVSCWSSEMTTGQRCISKSTLPAWR